MRKLSADEANKVLAEKSGGPEFKELFDGKSLAVGLGLKTTTKFVDGSHQMQSRHGGVLRTEEMNKDFVVRVEFKLPPGGNNGLAIRYPGEGDPAYSGMTSCRSLDTEHPMYAKIDPRQAHGSAYGMTPAVRGYLRPTGQWNFQVVTVKVSTIKVELNGTPILDTDLSTVTELMSNTPHPGKDRNRRLLRICRTQRPRAVPKRLHQEAVNPCPISRMAFVRYPPLTGGISAISWPGASGVESGMN